MDAAGENWFSRIIAQSSWLKYVGMLIIFTAAFFLLHREFSTIKFKDVAESFHALAWSAIGVAAVLTCLNYLVMICYDWLALKLINHPLKLMQIAQASLLSYSFTNTLGTIFGGTPVRVRLYSAWGLSASEVFRLIFSIVLTFWIGLLTVSGILFTFEPFDIPHRFQISVSNSYPLGVILLCVVLAFFALCYLKRTPFRYKELHFQFPTLPIAMAQAGIAATDFLLASAVLYVLLPQDISIDFLPFAGIFVLATFVGMISHVPGGLGIFELVMVTMLPEASHHLVAALLAFRVIYYLFPFLLGVLTVAFLTLKSHRTKLDHFSKAIIIWTRAISPRIMTGAIFISGLILLLSGSLPAAEGRIQLLRRVVPLPMIELSHFLGSLVGAGLIILARGLQRRVDVAWGLTIALLSVGVVVSLSKGFDYEEAIILGVLLISLLPCRSHFYRRGNLLAPSFNIGWLTAILMTIVLIVWATMISYRHVPYSNDLWWKFAYQGDAPRSLRALLGMVVILGLAGIWKMLRPSQQTPQPADATQLSEVEKIVADSPATHSNLALLGDKRFLFSNDRQAVVMFGIQGKSWISMGDPIGPEKSADDAAWCFLEACDGAGVRPVFYQIDEEFLGRYIEMGMSLLKLGEEARVSLTEFTLEGSIRKDLRRSKKKAMEAGLTFEIVPRAEVEALLPQLKVISEEWLGEKSAGEKGFSLGFFDEVYLSRYDIAVVKNGEQPIAFANLWEGAEKQELSIDLMRYSKSAPYGVMEYLFTELMLWGHEQGYQWFNMGMAPLSGMEARRLGPMWNQVSSLLFEHGEHFYNFQGLRNYKDKFAPQWTPKYLATPGGLGTAGGLIDVSTLISGGIRKLLHK